MDPNLAKVVHRMAPHERRMWVGYALVAACLISLGVLSLQTVHSAIARTDEIITNDAEDVFDVERLRLASETLSRKTRSYLLTKNVPRSELDSLRGDLDARLARLDQRIKHGAGRAFLLEVRNAERHYATALASAIEMKQRGAPADAVAEHYDIEVSPWRERLDGALSSLARQQMLEFEDAKRDAAEHASLAFRFLSAAGGLAALVACGLGLLLASAFRTVKRQRIELEQSLERVAASNRDLDAFAGRIAHDLKNVLGPLPLAAGQLRAADDDRLTRLAERLERTATRATDMTDSLLAFSRGVHLAVTAESASLADAVHEVLDDLQPLIASADAKLEVDVDDVHVRCSPGLLAIVLINLLSNALKFLEGRTERRVSVSARSKARWCEVVVADSGPGIPEESRAKIFEPFYRISSSRAPGTGIGLATVQRIVLAHGGRITVDSRAGDGAAFHVWLPLSGAERTDELRETSEEVLRH